MRSDHNSDHERRELPFRLRETAGIARRAEVVTLGLPLPADARLNPAAVRLRTESACAIPVQPKVLAQTPEGNPTWLQISFPASTPAAESETFVLSWGEPALSATSEAQAAPPPQATFQVGAAGGETLFSHAPDSPCRLVAHDEQGRPRVARLKNVRLAESGPVRKVWELEGAFPGLPLRLRVVLAWVEATCDLDCRITLENRGRAQHPGGYWDLGDPGSVLLQGLSLQWAIPISPAARWSWNTQPQAPLSLIEGRSWRLEQESSGGEAWDSRVHVDRDNHVPWTYRGYRVRAGEVGREQIVEEGLRATPALVVHDGAFARAFTLVEFWEKFPSGLEWDRTTVSAQLWPRRSGRLHELQAGERLTREIRWTSGETAESALDRLDAARSPLHLELPASRMDFGRTIPYLPPADATPRTELAQLLGQMLEGPDSFFAKREVLDEFGWRHFGDCWADHEQQYYKGPAPVVSHYNNQYDLLHGLLVQYVLSGDRRWWELADPLARHVIDIDIYHTDFDKSAYSGGMFWHTAHYHDAGTCTHRTMSTKMLGKEIPAVGGGPGNEHNYSTGLLLYYLLTGFQPAADAVRQLADWVVTMDDGDEHLLGLVADQPTGQASATFDPEYHGPGRGAGNSIQSLINGWLLTHDPRYPRQMEAIIRRTIHPRDDVSARELLNAEARWSYTVYLQALPRFLETIPEACVGRSFHAYVRAALCRYADWMSEHEHCYLDTPEQLEYPTETWAAQDLRKGNVLRQAARYTTGEARQKWQQRGSEITEQAWRQLTSFATRGQTRPAALVLQQAYIETCLNQTSPAEVAADCSDCEGEYGEPTVFATQKRRAKQRLRSPGAYPGIMVRMLNPRRWHALWRRSWAAQRLRRLS